MYAIVRIQGKGRGVVATRDIPEGAEIVTCPVVVVDGTDAGRLAKTRLGEYHFRFGEQDRHSCIVFGAISLCNHAESPNAELVCDENDETMTLVALDDIRAGEEICIRYRRPLWFTPAPMVGAHRQRVPQRAAPHRRARSRA